MGIISKIINWLFGSGDEKDSNVKQNSTDDNTPKPEPATSEDKKNKEHKWEDTNEQIKFVNQNGKILCTFCANPIGDFLVTSNQVSLQDNLYVTDGDNQPINLNFKGVCLAPTQQKPLCPPPPCMAVRNFGKWINVSKTHIDDNQALLVKSTIKCIAGGGVDIKIIDSGQRTTLSNIEPRLQRKRKITDAYWKEEGSDEKLYLEFPGESVTLYLETQDYKPGEIATVIYKSNGKRRFFGNKKEIAAFGEVDAQGLVTIKDFLIKYED